MVENPTTELQQTDDVEVERRRVPIVAWVFYGVAALSAIVYIIFVCSESFADWFNLHVASLFRALLAHLTSWLPFSLAEYLLLLLPVLVVILARFGIRRYGGSWRNVGVFCVSMLSIAALVFSLFTFGFASAYHGSKLEKKLGLDSVEVDADSLYMTALLLSERLNDEYGEVLYATESGFSVMPYNYTEMNRRLLDAYDTVCNQYDFVQRLDSRLKPVMLSGAMSYTHITGVYTFFTGEANINVAFPDYTIPFTAAHELAHQRGIAREDEANFMAFLVCDASEDPYIRYSGYLNLLEYVLSALRTASPSLYLQAYMTLPHSVTAELSAYSDFFDQYRDSVVGEVSGAVNDTVLTIHGTEGTRSYGLVVELAVAYFAPTEYNE